MMRFSKSLTVARESWAVLRSNPSLSLFPLISGIAVIIASAPFVAALFMTGLGHDRHVYFDALHYAITASMYFVNMFLIVFFNSALVACANENLQGRPADIGFGLRQAMKRLPQILCWTAIASTVGLVLRFVGERTGFIGSIITSLIGMAWNIVVFFVVPVLVLENVGPITAVKTSGEMLKRTWGERILLGIGLSTVIFLLGILVVIPFGLAVALLVQHLYPLAIFLFIAALMYILVLAVIGSALGTIYQTALYLYCRSGAIPAGFRIETMQDAFRAKPQSKFFGRNI